MVVLEIAHLDIAGMAASYNRPHGGLPQAASHALRRHGRLLQSQLAQGPSSHNLGIVAAILRSILGPRIDCGTHDEVNSSQAGDDPIRLVLPAERIRSGG